MMHAPAVTVFPTLEAFQRGAAERIGEIIRRVLSRRGVCSIALAGGSTPGPVYEHLSAMPLRWAEVQVYFTDERAVPPDHAESNYRLVRSALLDRVPMPRHQVHRMRGELSPDEAARAYEAELPASPDLAVLGMGADGHTASLFPGTDVLGERERKVREVFVPSLGAWRITLTIPYLARAGEVLVLAAGKTKAPAIARVLSLTAPDPRLPVSLLTGRRSPVQWLLDAEASPVQEGGSPVP